MALTYGTITGQFFDPSVAGAGLRLGLTIVNTAESGTAKSVSEGIVIACEYEAVTNTEGEFVDGDGNPLRLPLNAQLEPEGNAWRAIFRRLDRTNGPKPATKTFVLTGDTTWAALVDVAGGSVADDVISLLQSLRDAAVAAAESAADSAAAAAAVGATQDAIIASRVQDAASASAAAVSVATGNPPLPFRAVTTATEGGSDKRAFDYLRGYWWGWDSSSKIWRSVDGVTWTDYATCPAGQPQAILPTPGSGADDAVVVTAQSVYKVAGFFTAANPTFSAAKVTRHTDGASSANFTRFTQSSVAQGRTTSDDGEKLIVTQYGAGTGFTASRYAHISTNYGVTWTPGLRLGRPDRQRGRPLPRPRLRILPV